MTELVVMSFAFSRGEPPDANLVFDMRFLRNPHWQEHLRPLSGLDEPVGAYIAGDAAYEEALSRIEASAADPAAALPGATAKRLSASPSAAPAGATGPSMSRSKSLHGCARRDFRPLSTIATSPRRLATVSSDPQGAVRKRSGADGC